MTEQKYAVVTGGSEGVGFAVAQMLAGHGMHVILLARDKEKLAAAHTALGGGENISVFSVDVSNEGAIAEVKNYISVVTGQIDVLVNAAGTFRWDPSDINLMTLNADSKEFILHAFHDLIIPGSFVINISSQAALFAPEDPRRTGEEEYVASSGGQISEVP